jgi:hypothetical protein
LYGCDTWCVTVKEEQWLFQRRVLRNLFGPNRDRLIGDWTKLWVGPVACVGEKRNIQGFGGEV